MTDSTSFDTEFDSLPSATAERVALRADAERSDKLGVVIGGSLSEGLDVKLDRERGLEELAVGRYVVARGRRARFFCMITDVALDSTNPLIAKQPPDMSDPFLAEVHQGTTTFGTVHLSPLLILEEGKDEPKPVKTVPEHFTPVSTASQAEVDQVFGEEGARQVGGKTTHHFHIGAPLDMESVKITLNLERLVERSSGVFGKSGTGKTFLSRLLLAGIIQQRVAVNLIFDMHNEYGWAGTSEDVSGQVKGLKQIFPGQVSIFTLDDESSRRRGSNPDYTVTIGYDQIEPEDLEMLAGILNLSEPQVGAVYALYRKFGKTWLTDFLNDDWVDAYGGFDPDTGKEVSGLKALAEDTGQSQNTLAALRRRFERMRNYDFLKPKAHRRLGGPDHEIPGGRHQRRAGVRPLRLGPGRLHPGRQLPHPAHPRAVRREEGEVVRRGRQGAARRWSSPSRRRTSSSTRPSPANTIFGTIARELRKYNVTLFIVDQRPSGIDAEVMSQIGTRVTMLLDNRRTSRPCCRASAAGRRCVRCWPGSTRASRRSSSATPCRCRSSSRRGVTTRSSTRRWASPRPEELRPDARTQRRRPCGRRRSSRGLIDCRPERGRRG